MFDLMMIFLNLFFNLQCITYILLIMIRISVTTPQHEYCLTNLIFKFLIKAVHNAAKQIYRRMMMIACITFHQPHFMTKESRSDLMSYRPHLPQIRSRFMTQKQTLHSHLPNILKHPYDSWVKGFGTKSGVRLTNHSIMKTPDQESNMIMKVQWSGGGSFAAGQFVIISGT